MAAKKGGHWVCIVLTDGNIEMQSLQFKKRRSNHLYCIERHDLDGDCNAQVSDERALGVQVPAIEIPIVII